jgi:hypothetical protein
MTTNAFIFCWDQNGIESIVPISQYEDWDKTNLFNMIAGRSVDKNPIDAIIRNMLLRARINSHRQYEVYAVECDIDLDEKFWRRQWQSDHAHTADLVRDRGHKLYSDRTTNNIGVTYEN